MKYGYKERVYAALGTFLVLAALLSFGAIRGMVTTIEAGDTATKTYLPLAMNDFPPMPVVPVLSITKQSTSVYDLSWTNPEPNKTDYFIIEMSAANTFPVTSTMQVTQTSTTYTVDVSGLDAAHYFRVRGANQYLIGPLSNEVSAISQHFSVEKTLIDTAAQECTTLNWSFTGVDFVLLNAAYGFSPAERVETDSMTICPSRDTEYRLQAFYHDGTRVDSSIEVEVTRRKCNRDPWVRQFNPTATQVNRNEIITVSWDIRCASRVFLQLNADPIHTVEHEGQSQYKMERSTFFMMRVVKDEGGEKVFDEEVNFGVTVRPNTR